VNSVLWLSLGLCAYWPHDSSIISFQKDLGFDHHFSTVCGLTSLKITFRSKARLTPTIIKTAHIVDKTKEENKGVRKIRWLQRRKTTLFRPISLSRAKIDGCHTGIPCQIYSNSWKITFKSNLWVWLFWNSNKTNWTKWTVIPICKMNVDLEGQSWSLPPCCCEWGTQLWHIEGTCCVE
jgi:hypothetical protein